MKNIKILTHLHRIGFLHFMKVTSLSRLEQEEQMSIYLGNILKFELWTNLTLHNRQTVNYWNLLSCFAAVPSTQSLKSIIPALWLTGTFGKKFLKHIQYQVKSKSTTSAALYTFLLAFKSVIYLGVKVLFKSYHGNQTARGI